MAEQKFRFLGNVVIRFYVVCKTGLHIGGGDEGYEIGGMENTVIKDPLSGVPFLPGSTFKGKSRSLLEWEKGLNIEKNKKGEWTSGPCGCAREDCDVCTIYGTSASNAGTSLIGPTRVIFEDFFPTKKTVERWQAILGKGMYTEIKYENTLDRLTSAANPRQMERVPADSEFEGQCVYRVLCEKDVDRLQTLFRGLAMVSDNFLGGGGSRGSGSVGLEDFHISWRGRDYYHGGQEAVYRQNQENSGADANETQDAPIPEIQDVISDFQQIAQWIRKQIDSENKQKS